MSNIDKGPESVVISRIEQGSEEDFISMRVLGESIPERFVFAHVVQGNYQFYNAEDWVEDMKLAKRNHIDAFAINIGRDKTNKRQIPLIYECAERESFHVFLSFDMCYYGQPFSSKDVSEIIKMFVRRKGNFRFLGKPLVSTFSGEVSSTFLDNNPDYDTAWQSLKGNLGFPVSDPSRTPSADGLLSWDAWCPVSLSADSTNIKKLLENGKQYAAPISAFFFKRLSDNEGDNYTYTTDHWFVIQKYLYIISCSPQFVELLSWNDYGESHYLRDPISSANLPHGTLYSASYVNGYPHEPLLDLISYFNLWFKTGKRPPISCSKAYMWYRCHPKEAKPTSRPFPSAPTSYSETIDSIYMVLMISSTTLVKSARIITGSRVYEISLGPNLGKGIGGDILRISVPFEVGVCQSLSLFDHSKSLVCQIKGKEIVDLPQDYNFNYWTGMKSF
ncbi:family 71 glycoside hydrolase [Phakopsora pachyrhizi]|nr:family 71 glycoside hydrolase [Phakopsora pachyrhizi]